MNLPPYATFPEISAYNILLRQILPTDIKDIVEISRYDAKPASTVQEAMEMQEKINNDYQNGNSIHWGIVDKAKGIVVGTCGYYRGLDQGGGEVGCILKPVFRGQGYMTEAIKLAVQFGINTIGLKKITAITTTSNEKAIKLLSRLNFKKKADLEDNEVKYEFNNK